MPQTILRQTILRQATRADIPQMSRVRNMVHENRLFPGVTIPAERVREAIEETGRGWVIEADGEVVAMAIGNAADGSVWAMFVRPECEGLGYGRRLHAEMVAWLWGRGLDGLWLTTDPGTRAEGFYRHLGWRFAGPAEHGEIRMELRR